MNNFLLKSIPGLLQYLLLFFELWFVFSTNTFWCYIGSRAQSNFSPRRGKTASTNYVATCCWICSNVTLILCLQKQPKATVFCQKLYTKYSTSVLFKGFSRKILFFEKKLREKNLILVFYLRQNLSRWTRSKFIQFKIEIGYKMLFYYVVKTDFDITFILTHKLLLFHTHWLNFWIIHNFSMQNKSFPPLLIRKAFTTFRTRVLNA